MPATLIREFAEPDIARLQAVLADLASLPEQLVERRKQLFREAALKNRAQELHDGREEYRQLYDDYIGVAETFRTLAQRAGSPLAEKFERIAEAIRQQRDELFARWNTFDDLCEILVDHFPLTSAQLKDYVDRHPAPQSWYDETGDPFAPQT